MIRKEAPPRHGLRERERGGGRTHCGRKAVAEHHGNLVDVLAKPNRLGAWLHLHWGWLLRGKRNGQKYAEKRTPSYSAAKTSPAHLGAWQKKAGLGFIYGRGRKLTPTVQAGLQLTETLAKARDALHAMHPVTRRVIPAVLPSH